MHLPITSETALDASGASLPAEAAVRTRPGLREALPPRAFDPRGMGFRHDLLLALIMAVVMTATVFLYR